MPHRDVRPNRRLMALRAAIAQEGLEALLVSRLANIQYLCGFSGSAGRLLVSRRDAFLIVDGRYVRQALEEAPGCSVIQAGSGDFTEEIVEAIGLSEARRVGFESGTITYWDHGRLEVSLSSTHVLVPAGGEVERLRRIKDDTEIACLRAAGHATAAAMNEVLCLPLVGLSEVEVAARVEYHLRRLAFEAPSFETLVASGPASARIHARPREAAIVAGAPLLIDAGATFLGYRSDMTRTVAPGQRNRRFERLHGAVLAAHGAVLAAIRPGALPEDLDALACGVLADHGLERYFTHALGHGVGLEAHEEPWLAQGEREGLEAGMVIAVEPGVYLEAFGGVRHEDTVLVTATGCEVLTQAVGRPSATGVLSWD